MKNNNVDITQQPERIMKILVGCEESQAVCIAFRERGHEAYSCDLKPCSGGHPEWHLQMDIFQAIRSRDWDMGIFFPDCTYLTCSAEWAYKNPPYHQKVHQDTLVGHARIQAREAALRFVRDLMNCGIPRIAIENPVGVIGSRIFKYVGEFGNENRWEVFHKALDNGGRSPSQIIQPYQFGDNASKKTCLWLTGLPPLIPTSYFPPRIINGKKRWGNQTDSGQNNVTQKHGNKVRAELRSKTYPGIAKAMAEQWG